MKELSEVLQDWEAVIGLEIHSRAHRTRYQDVLQLQTATMTGPTPTCPVCLGLPGACRCPTSAPSRASSGRSRRNCEIQRHSMFYRKHYFYPDMAKNFQTTQGRSLLPCAATWILM